MEYVYSNFIRHGPILAMTPILLKRNPLRGEFLYIKVHNSLPYNKEETLLKNCYSDERMKSMDDSSD